MKVLVSLWHWISEWTWRCLMQVRGLLNLPWREYWKCLSKWQTHHIDIQTQTTCNLFHQYGFIRAIVKVKTIRDVTRWHFWNFIFLYSSSCLKHCSPITFGISEKFWNKLSELNGKRVHWIELLIVLKLCNNRKTTFWIRLYGKF